MINSGYLRHLRLRQPLALKAQLYWKYVAPNEPGRLPRNSPRRIARRANAKIHPSQDLFDDVAFIPPGCLTSWKRGVWA